MFAFSSLVLTSEELVLLEEKGNDLQFGCEVVTPFSLLQTMSSMTFCGETSFS